MVDFCEGAGYSVSINRLDTELLTSIFGQYFVVDKN